MATIKLTKSWVVQAGAASMQMGHTRVQGCECVCEKNSEMPEKMCFSKCIQGLKMGFCEEPKKSKIRSKSELSHPRE